jgi:membrane protease YdiL (CAAX protease family)
MLLAIQWKPQHLLLFIAGLFCCLSFATLAAATVRSPWLELNPVDANFMAFLLNTLFLDGGALLVVHLLLQSHEAPWRAFLGIDATRLRQHVLLGLMVGIGVVPVLLGVNRLCYLALTVISEEPVQQITVQIAQDLRGWIRRITFGIAAITLAPMAEEFVFRGVLYPAIRQRGWPRLALFGTAFLFALIHGNTMTFVPLFIFALILVWLVERTGGLVAPTIAHAVFNALNFVLVLNDAWFTNLWERLRERI